MPELTASELAKEAEQEAAVFSQAVNVEKLLNMLRAFDPAKDNLADNEEIQVRSCFMSTSVSVDLFFPGTLSFKHGLKTQDREAY